MYIAVEAINGESVGMNESHSQKALGLAAAEGRLGGVYENAHPSMLPVWGPIQNDLTLLNANRLSPSSDRNTALERHQNDADISCGCLAQKHLSVEPGVDQEVDV